MKVVRIVLRLVSMTLLSLVFYAFLLVSTAALALFLGLRGRRRATGPWRTALFHAWSRGMAALLGMRVDSSGDPPRSPFFLVANHLGYIDVILLGSRLRCVFVAKAEVERWPLIGLLCASADTVFIERENKRDIPRVIERIEGILRDGRGVVVFPEGTSSKGAEVTRFRPSLLEAAASAGIPVHYASLSYATPPGARPAHLSVCWWGEMGFGEHVLRLLALPGFRARVDWGEEPILERDRKILARRLQRAVEARFQPVV